MPDISLMLLIILKTLKNKEKGFIKIKEIAHMAVNVFSPVDASTA